MLVYKLTDEEGQTHGGTQWGEMRAAVAAEEEEAAKAVEVAATEKPFDLIAIAHQAMAF